MKIFIDIETVKAYKNLADAPDEYRVAWTDFSMKKWPEESSHKTYDDNAAIYPEFGKIICISVKRDANQVKSFYGDDEYTILSRFSDAVEQIFNSSATVIFVGHRIKTFDIPYINIRCIAHKLPIIAPFLTYGKKPWELTNFIDTWEVWKGGIFNSVQCSSLQSICLTLGVPSPKDDISGADVGKVYWEDEDIERIVTYCEKDVDRTAQAFNLMADLKMM